jgi:CRP-like cAMP-binding protein
LSTTANQLIAGLPRKDRIRLLACCDEVELVLADVLCEAGSTTRHAYFPSSAYISLVTSLGSKPVLEVGMIGKEGMLGTQLALGVMAAPLFALVQGPGMAWRITAAKLSREIADSKALRASLHRYVEVTLVQLASASACLRFHDIGQRLARWLLMSQDRAGSESFHITQEFLAYMLGVRRVGITTAAVALHRQGLITYQRGAIRVLDRAALEKAACSCYATDKACYADLMH